MYSKEKEISELQQTNEDNALEIVSLQKKIRELEASIREMGEDLENEINARSKVCHDVYILILVYQKMVQMRWYIIYGFNFTH